MCISISKNPAFDALARAVFLPIGFMAAFAMATACSDKSDSCVANVDCTGEKACVWGRCIDDPAKCEVVGGFEETFDLSEFQTETVDEFHAVVDKNGAVHYCYYGTVSGTPYGFYAKQTAHDTFEHMALGETGTDRCGAITISSEGKPFVLRRNSPALLQPSAGGGWGVIPLTGLEGVEAQGAVSGDRALITLTPDDLGGVFVSMSLGYQLENQPMYLGRVFNGELEVLVNGWSESGDYTNLGHAPQFLSLSASQSGINEPQVFLLHGEVLSFNIVLSDEEMNQFDEIEGLYPRGAAGADGSKRLVYLDRNYQLRVDVIDNDGQLGELSQIEKIGIDESSDGQVPWEVAVDRGGTAHILYEDKNQGQNAVLYAQVSADGTVTTPFFLSDSVPSELPGMQKYALNTDICKRATVVSIEKKTVENTIVTALKITEGR